MSLFQPPPTAALPTVGKGISESYNPIWIKWFIDLVKTLNTAVGGGGSSTTTALEVFGKKEVPGFPASLYRADSQAIEAAQVFGRKEVSVTLYDTALEPILAGQIFGG